MGTEVPKLRRCCFCIPLRRGLLVWSYLHMITTFLYGAYGINLWSLFMIHCFRYNYCGGEFAVIDLIAFITVFNCILSGQLVYGAHKKSHKILNIQYYGATVSVIIFSIIVIIDFNIRVTQNVYLLKEIGFLWRLLVNGVVYTTYILIQLYVIVLVRSEVFKLRDNQQFQFKNEASDAEANCTLYLGNKEESNSTEQ